MFVVEGDRAEKTMLRKRRNGNCLAVGFTVVSVPLIFIYLGYYIGSLFMPLPPRFSKPGIVKDMSLLNYSWYNTHNLTIAFAGGLGNQMFQYAALYGISKANGFQPLLCGETVVGRVFPRLKVRRIDQAVGPVTKSYGVYLERQSNAFDSRALSLNFMQNIVLDGFFQSWRYFDHVRSDIQNQFRFRSSTVATVNKFLSDSAKLLADSADPVIFVGIHVRRGDLLHSYNVKAGYTVPDGAYFTRAMKYFGKKFDRVVFVVCSDDMPWSTTNIQSPLSHSAVVFSQFSSLSPEFDLALLSHCNHSIITVGSFGWWAAWLVGGETVYFREFPRAGSSLRDSFRMGDYYLPKWIAM